MILHYISALLFAWATVAEAQTLSRMVVSVADVWPGQGQDDRTKVHITLVVHTPTEFRGLKIQVNDEKLTRADARAKFPIGALFALTIPLSVVDDLKAKRRQDVHVQSQIDQGIDRRAISQIVMPAQLNLSDLPSPPVPVSIPPL